jgi:hypothetical protein
MTRLRKGSKRLDALVPETRDTLVARIDTFLILLASPLSEEEIESGWTSTRASHCHELLLDVRTKLVRGEAVAYLPLGRWADHMSITSGPMLEELCAISVGLNGRTW